MEQHEPSGTDAPWVTQWVTQRMGAAGTRASDSVRLAVCQLLVWSCVCAVLLLDAAPGFAFGRWRKLSRVGCRGLELNSFSLCPSPSSASSHVSAVNCEAKQNKPPASPLFFFFFFYNDLISCFAQGTPLRRRAACLLACPPGLRPEAGTGWHSGRESGAFILSSLMGQDCVA